jgi:hypothetical protein
MPSLFPQKVASGTSADNTALVITIAKAADLVTHVYAWHAHFQDGTAGKTATLAITQDGSAVSVIHRIGAQAQAHMEGLDLVADANTDVTLTIEAGGAGKISEAWVVYNQERD